MLKTSLRGGLRGPPLDFFYLEPVTNRVKYNSFHAFFLKKSCNFYINGRSTLNPPPLGTK